MLNKEFAMQDQVIQIQYLCFLLSFVIFSFFLVSFFTWRPIKYGLALWSVILLACSCFTYLTYGSALELLLELQPTSNPESIVKRDLTILLKTYTYFVPSVLLSTGIVMFKTFIDATRPNKI